MFYYFEVFINKQIVSLNAIQLIDRKKIIIQIQGQIANRTYRMISYRHMR